MGGFTEVTTDKQQLANSTGKTTINCGTCSKSFLKRRDYNRHRKTHDRPYHCGLCSAKYALKTDLERHGAQHVRSSARFHCHWPGCRHRGSVRKDNLLKHMNREHLTTEGLNLNNEEQAIRKLEVLRLYKKATENEKLLTAERAKKISLLEAIIRGDDSIVRHLLDNWADLQTAGASKASSLHEAIMKAVEVGNTTGLSLVIAKGAPMDFRDRQQRTPLLLAAEKGQDDLVEVLLNKGAVVDAKDQRGYTALFWAAQNGHGAVAALLLRSGAMVDAKDWYGDTALLRAAQNGHEAVAALLLRSGAMVDAKDWYGDKPLLWAAQNGHEAVVKHLLERGTQFDTRDWQCYKPLLQAARNGHEAVVKLLLEAKTEAHPEGLRVELPHASPLPQTLDNVPEIVVNLLIENGAAVDSKDYQGKTMLSWCSEIGLEDVIRRLIENGAALDPKDFEGKTPLHLALRPGYEAIVRLLQEKGANFELRDYSGFTPLHYAVHYSSSKVIVQLLLEAGADVKTRTDWGRDLLASCKDEEIRSLVQEYAARIGHKFGRRG